MSSPQATQLSRSVVRRHLDAPLNYAATLTSTEEGRGREDSSFRKTLSCLGDGVLVLAPSGRPLYANPAVKRLLEKPAAELSAQRTGIPLIDGCRTVLEGRLGARYEVRVNATIWEGQPAFVAVLRELRPAWDSQASVERLRTKLAATDRHLTEMSTLDPLTTLLNRRGLERSFRNEQRRGQKEGLSLCAMLIDCEISEELNQRLGRAFGDAVVMTIAARLVDAVGPHARSGRLASNRFLVLLPGCSPSEASALAERTLHAINARPIHGVGEPVSVSVSIGISPVDHETPELDPLVERCHLALEHSEADAGDDLAADILDGPGVYRQPA